VVPSGECLRSSQGGLVGGVGGRKKLCDPVNICHSEALRDCLGRKNAQYKYLILYFNLNK